MNRYNSVLDYNRAQFRLSYAMGGLEAFPSRGTPTEWILPPPVPGAEPIGPPILPDPAG